MLSTYLARARKSLLLKNSVSLMLVQVGGNFAPLIVTPYLARTLGIESFGALAMAMGIAAYLSVIVDWGFPLSGPREVARNRDDPEKLKQIFWSVMSAKMLLAGSCMAAFCLVAPLWDVFGSHFWLCCAAALQILALTISGGWFLGGLENMMRPSFYGLLIRLLGVPVTLLLVKSPNDVAIAMAVQSGGAVLGALVTLWYIRKDTDVLGSPRLSLRAAIAELKHSGVLFVSMGAMSLFTYANVVVLGAMSGLAQAAIFNGGHRIMRAGQSLLDPLSNAFYPRINNLMTHNKASARRVMLTLFVAQFGSGLVLAGGVAIFAPWIVAGFLGREFTATVPVLQIMCGVMLLATISNTLGTNMLLPMGMKSTFATIMVISGAVNLILLFLLIPIAGPIGAACAMLMTEIVIISCKAFMVYRHRHRL